MWTTVTIAAWTSAVAGEYRLGAGDALSVTVYEEPSLSGELVVSDACTISLGLIGRLEVCALTVSEVEQLIVDRYSSGYLVNPSISVKVVRYHSQRVDVLGEVAHPGPQYLEGPTSLVEVVSMAGGARADNVVQVDIVHADGTVDRVDLTDLPVGGPVLVREGDQVFLKPGEVVYVEGQIARPGAVTLGEGLTVTQALSLAGGPTEFASVRRVLLNRADGSKLRINVNRIHRGAEEDPVLMPDDHLIVPQSAF